MISTNPMDYQLLEFDTQLFGFKTAKILTSRLTIEKLKIILDELQKQNIRLVYWPSDSTDIISQHAAQKLGGFLGSEHITYLIDLKKLNPAQLAAPTVEIYENKSKLTNNDLELEQLAIQAGVCSHFNTDPNFPKELFFKLYNQWIENSINGSIATRVIVIRRASKIIGMATLGTKNARGDIGLLAIHSDFRGHNFGTKLVYAAQTYFIASGFAYAQVVTQKANIPACRLYEKCGFHQAKTENFFHFWL